MQSKVSTRMLTSRGWALAAAGVVALLSAQVLGRRDLLLLAVFLILLPLAAALALRLLRPALTVERTFAPATAQTGTAVNISLSVTPVRPFTASAKMQEELPPRFGASPQFRFPASRTDPRGTSRYEYRLRSSRRGMYRIGPVSAGFQDPFGLALLRHTIGGTDPLIVKPAPAELPAGVLEGLRGSDGPVAARLQGVASQDDVTTREYRHGDPMRRVHWSATARHGELMVRQEEPVTTPRATLILDQRESCYDTGFLSPFWAEAADGSAPASSESFEWAVSAVMSIGAHLMEHGFAVRVLDVLARPGLARSPSAVDPGTDTFTGPGGIEDLGEGLAALGLEAPGAGAPEPQAAKLLRRRTSGVPGGAQAWTGPQQAPGVRGPFGDVLTEALLSQTQRGPLVVVTGALTEADARRLAPTGELAPAAVALLVCDRPAAAAPALTVLREAGWSAVAVAPSRPLASVWSETPPAGQRTVQLGGGR